ncbi:IS200/IS605 family transposase [Lentzea sp. E54]|uniref:IS200/IS605 family transposase n=1 Tax=Lentzea xerophila TaxID=3435883 RepID=UPI003DA40C25
MCADFETELVEFNGENNHIHLLVNFPPKIAISKLVNSLKGVFSRRMRQEFPELARTTAGHNGSGPARTSPVRSAAPRSPGYGSTSSSRTPRLRAPSAAAGLPRGPSPPD